MVIVAVVVVSVVWSAVAERSGDTAFGETGCLRKRRGAPLPAAVQNSLVAVVQNCAAAWSALGQVLEIQSPLQDSNFES
jgi:hypothetical protein